MKNQHGMTLIEMVVAMALAAIVISVGYQMFMNAQQARMAFSGRTDAERQALLLLQRVQRYFAEKKPGDIIEAKKATDAVMFRDYSCNKCPTPTLAQRQADPYKSYSFTLHNDTEGCLLDKFPTRLLGCKGISIARGMWTEANAACGCAAVRKADLYTALTKCQKIDAPSSTPFGKINFVGSKSNPLAECTVCKVGERPVVIENRYNPSKPESADKWFVYPDQRIATASGTKNAVSFKEVKKSLEDMASSAVGMELCTHVDGDSVMFDVNSFYVVRAQDEAGKNTLIVRKFKQRTSFPKNVVDNNDLRFIPE